MAPSGSVSMQVLYSLSSSSRADSWGPKTITIPWAGPSSSVTYAFERFAIRLLKAAKNQTKTADLLRCGFNQLNRMMHRAVERGESRRSLVGIQHIRIDEKALKRDIPTQRL